MNRAILCAWVMTLGLTGASAASMFAPADLRCEYVRQPLGVDVPSPRLFWKLTGEARGQVQTAYHILVASSSDLLARDKGDLWDTAKVKSEQTTHIAYAGRPLTSSQQIFWKVRAWDNSGQASRWSESASWTMGLLAKGDWHAQWIGATASNTSNQQFIGYHSATARDPDETKWVQVDLGKPALLSSVRLVPMVHAGRKGFGFPVRFKLEAAEDANFSKSALVVDHTGADFPNPGEKPVVFHANGKTARYVRLTVTKLWKRDAMFCFALCEMEVESQDRNIAEREKVTALDTVESYGWGKVGLTDGYCGATPKITAPQTILLRREFVIKPRLRRAVAHVCGLGAFELTINGRKAGEDLFPSGWTKYDKTCLYETYDITPLMRPGTNAAGVVLANAMYNVVGGRYTKFTGSFGPLRAIAQLRLEYLDGTTDLVTTDPDWRWLPGPITFSCVYGGEDYDARLEPRGWDQPGFDAALWQSPLVTQGPGGALRGLSCAAPPVRAFDTLKPVKMTKLAPATLIYDLGQNASLMPRLRVHGPHGAKIRITPAELVATDGTLDRSSCGRRPAYWEYTLSGQGAESWFPKFYYHGARYLQVEATTPPAGELPTIDSLEGIVVHSSSDPVGDFECSNDLFNRIRKLVRWAQRSNMMSVMTDCPHREKLGWLEEDHLNGPSLRYEFALDKLFTKVLNDMADSQLENGLVPDIAPEYVQFNGGFRDSPEWGSAVLLVPWQQYQFSGDLDLLRNYYRPMQRYVEYLGSRAKDHIVSHGLGDWYDIGPKPPGVAQLTPVPLTATAFYYYDALILSQTAALLGKTADAKKYRALASDVRTAFNHTFFDATKRTYATGSQCANAMALVMNLAEPAERTAILDAIVKDVRARGNALTAGDVGYRYLLCALAEGGRSDLIFDINNQSEKPGYGYQLKQGATSLTEAWDAGRSSSQNHFMLGQIMEWFYHDLAGIASDPEGPGFKKIIIKPAPVGNLAWVRATYDSIQGPITTRWERASGSFTLAVSIPANTTATVYVPSENADRITESGKTTKGQKAVNFIRQERGYSVFAVGSGSFRFQVER